MRYRPSLSGEADAAEGDIDGGFRGGDEDPGVAAGVVIPEIGHGAVAAAGKLALHLEDPRAIDNNIGERRQKKQEEGAETRARASQEIHDNPLPPPPPIFQLQTNARINSSSNDDPNSFLLF